MAENGKKGAWSPFWNDLGQWIQVDLGEITMVTKVATQGGQEEAQWVTEFKVSYSVYGGHFKFHQKAPNNSFGQVKCKWIQFLYHRLLVPPWVGC